MKALYFVVGILLLSIFMFLLGNPTSDTVSFSFMDTASDSESFFYVFTIIFPAFTGIAAWIRFVYIIFTT